MNTWMLIGRRNARYSKVGADDSSTNGSSDSARFPRRSSKFPSRVYAAPNSTGHTGPELGATDPSTQTIVIDVHANEITRENREVSPTVGASSQPIGPSDSSPSPRPPFCQCPFPWTRTASSKDTVCSGQEHFKLRHLSRAEKYHFEKSLTDPYLQTMCGNTLFNGPRERLKVWPRFFKSTDASGLELRDGFVTLWSTFIIAESLLASVAIQPLVTNMDNLCGWQLEVYGLLWMLALICNFVALAVTALFLGFLHGSPGKLAYFWLCNIGVWIGIPSVLVLLATFVSLLAIAYSSWVMYGAKVGIICAIVEVLVVTFSLAASTSLENACQATVALD